MENPKSKIQARFFHVVGGGCFGSQYTRWLQIAKTRGFLDYERIFIIDHNPQCGWVEKPRSLKREGFQPQVIQQDWVEYLTAYLLQNFQNSAASQDHWVPSPLSPHLIYLSFLKAAEHLRPKIQFKAKPIQEPLPLPVRIPLQNGDLALSFAQWQCPTHCTEPKRCPAIQGPRIWNQKTTLEAYFLKKQQISFHLLQVSHLTHAVGTIPMRDMLREFQAFLDNLTKNPQEVLVATVSKCHGLLSRAQVLS